MRLSVDARRPFGVALGGLIAIAWLSLWLWGQSPYGRFLSHQGIDTAGGGGGLALTFVRGGALVIVGLEVPRRPALGLIVCRAYPPRRGPLPPRGLFIPG